MFYKEYFTNSQLEDVWQTLSSYYREPESLKTAYQALFYTIRNLPIDSNRSTGPLKLFCDFEGMVHVDGAPDPIEWMVGREVIFNNDDKVLNKLSVSEMTAHLLYWTTLYDFRTQTRYHKDCIQACEDSMNGITKNDLHDESLEISKKRKQAYYWKEAAATDSAWDWSYILDFMRKRIEYHIGYHRFTDRFVNSKHYVVRMELCCRLLKLATAHYYDDMDKSYVNTHNASRFIGRIFSEFDFRHLHEHDFKEVELSNLRRAKAYKILWKYLEHNLTYWWD